jgi:transcriptional regulator with PAS, ATPase and Fis domain
MSSMSCLSETLDLPLPGLIGNGDAMRMVYRLTRLVAPSSASVLLVGETGTGKELVARAIHRLSRRMDGPYVRVNCGALSENLLESELFGHVKGAFTGAVDNKTGRFEAAHGGTIFLDEISSMSSKLQVKLLRVLQEREFERVGDSRTVQVDTRVIAATNQRLEDEIDAGRFRQDLYYRLNVVPIHLPPLRERREDIAPLARFFVEQYSHENGRDVPELPVDFEKALIAHDWPGNVRELENCIERAIILSNGGPLSAESLDFSSWTPVRTTGRNLDGLIRNLVLAAVRNGDAAELHSRIVGEVERQLIAEVLRRSDNVQIKAAARLGISRNTLHKKLHDGDGR